MNKKQLPRIMVGDFETTVFDGQEFTEVWASALCDIYQENGVVFNSIGQTFDFLSEICRKENVILYYHNLKFDGSFWLDWLLKNACFTQAGYGDIETILNDNNHSFYKDKAMPNNSFKYMISDRGVWYNIKIKLHGHILEIRDSVKLLPFSVEKIGESFKTKHRKTEIEYKGFRYAGCEITDKEREYILNDIYVVKEGLEYLFNDGHNKATIGSCCLAEWKKSFLLKYNYTFNSEWECLNYFFPDLTKIEIDKNTYNANNADEYIRKSYKGGWCYLVPEKKGKIFKKGLTADVNSLYPSMMHSESGNYYPIGKPIFWKGNFPKRALDEDTNFFVRIKCRFNIKDNMLPFMQIKNSFLYPSHKCLTTSDFYDKYDKKYYRYYIDEKGERQDTTIELTLTQTDYKLFLEHYNLENFEILDGCYFHTMIGLFDDYINKYKEIKMNSVGALREEAKLFLNNLYGKLAMGTDSSYKVAYIKDGVVKFVAVSENNKKAGYIPIGSAITSYARNFTIRHAQSNYYGSNNRGFIYADTDSIHCDLDLEELKVNKIHKTDFNSWSIESQWDEGIFVRAKTYIEHVNIKDGVLLDKPFYDVKCAGMPKRPKKLFVANISNDKIELKTKEEEEFMLAQLTLSDFKEGLVVPSALKQKRIDGGIILYDKPYTMRYMR